MIIFYKNIILNLEISVESEANGKESFILMGGKRSEGALKGIVEDLK
jgi:hypothetical protein